MTLTSKVGGYLLGLLACASVLAHAQPVPCSKIQAAERERAREQGVCVDTPTVPPRRDTSAIPPTRELSPDRRSRVPAKDEIQPQPSARVWVRSFVGEQYDKAYAALKERHRVQSKRQSSAQPRGEVIEQKPRDTYVPRGTVVTLIVSDGSLAEPSPTPTAPPPEPDFVWVPSYIGKPSRAAQIDLIERLRLRPSTQPHASSAPRGQVVDQAPQETRVRAGTAVTLFVSDETLVRVPRLVSLPLDEAQQALTDKRLVPRVQMRRSDEPAGTVISQSPRPETEIKRGGTVVIAIAQESPPAPAPRPQPSPPVATPVAPTPSAPVPSPSPVAPTPVPSPSSVAPAPSAPVPPPSPVAPTPSAPVPPPAVVSPAPLPVPTPSPPELAPSAPAPQPALPESAPIPPPGPPLPSPPESGDDGPISPWWWLIALLPAAGAAAWLRGRRAAEPRHGGDRAAEHKVSAQFAGAESRPQLATHEGPPLRVTIEVSAPRPSASPAAQVSKENPDE